MESKDKVLAMSLLDKEPILCPGNPQICQNIAEGQPVLQASQDHLAKAVVLSQGRGLLALTGLLVGSPESLLDSLESDGQGHP